MLNPQTLKTITMRSNRYGLEYRDFVRGYLTKDPATTDLEIIGCIAANEMMITIAPSNDTIKIAYRKVREKWARERWAVKTNRPHNLDAQFKTFINAQVGNLLESYGEEFMDFVVGHTDILTREDIPEKHKSALKLLDYYLSDVTDHVRY